MIELTRYEDNTRKLPDIKYITPIVLLFWYLDDGSLIVSKQKRPNGRKPTIYRKLKISLQSFKDEDIIIFTKKLNEKFKLNFKIGYTKIKNEKKVSDIYISNNIKNITEFLDLIYIYKDLIPKEMHYKFCLCYHETRLLKDDSYNKYNVCNFHNTHMCECRNKDFQECFN